MSDITTHQADLKAEIVRYQAVGAPATKPHLTFAGVWPAARAALTLLGTLVPASVRMILTIVLSVGDTVAGSAPVQPA